MPSSESLCTIVEEWNNMLPDDLMNMENLTPDIKMKTPPKKIDRKKVNFDPADTAKVQREMYSALKARREALEEILKKRTEELKLLCIKEGELTGNLPPETPMVPGEEPPQIRRRVGTAFSLSADVVPTSGEDDEIKKLEMEVDLQKQITNAAHKLASDKSVSRFVRKQRRHSFIKAQSKLKEMEKKLREHRKGDSVPASPGSSTKYDGMYHVEHADQGYSFCDDTYVNRLPRSRQNHTSITHRLSRSFRERNLLRYHKLIDTRVKTDRNSTVLTDSSFDESGVSCESRLDDSRLADQTRSSLNSSTNSDAESYKISNDSLYHSSYRYIPEESLDSSFLTPPPVTKRSQKTVMSPNTRRSKRASWHHTMFQKSPQVPRANKETAV